MNVLKYFHVILHDFGCVLKGKLENQVFLHSCWMNVLVLFNDTVSVAAVM